MHPQVRTHQEAPIDRVARWFRTPGHTQSVVRWALLIPAALGIAVLSQFLFLMALSTVAPSTGEAVEKLVIPWLIHTFNAVVVPFLVIVLGTPIAPRFKRAAAVVLAILAVLLVSIVRLSFELPDRDWSPARTAWLVVSAVLCLVSAWQGLRRVWLK
ncbi:hypothetical protein ACGLHS_06500 [Variovorax sp. VaC1]|uniref:hypothetical protein n=1 Tax=Variovorax sp. VaC1 TaxID=3373132 RepID=UPI003748C52B